MYSKLIIAIFTVLVAAQAQVFYNAAPAVAEYAVGLFGPQVEIHRQLLVARRR